MPRPSIRFVATAGLREDFAALNEAAVHHPGGPEDRLLRVALNRLADIKSGAPGTHRLDAMPSYPDLSDCWTTYVGADPNRKPSHRLIWRELPANLPGEPATREVIALGERAAGRAYYLAGQRLQRPVGVSLEQLREQAEPINDRSSKPRPTVRPDAQGEGKPDPDGIEINL